MKNNQISKDLLALIGDIRVDFSNIPSFINTHYQNDKHIFNLLQELGKNLENLVTIKLDIEDLQVIIVNIYDIHSKIMDLCLTIERQNQITDLITDRINNYKEVSLSKELYEVLDNFNHFLTGYNTLFDMINKIKDK